ncbi:isocitrate lyase/PEP mutase family protein [Marinivivus vitaminiproducens]|uniref:isocitrate lyase/PEP mutase family protein n=1 Tax=Marinivivus vitaminiproducens TaxID=3035935 RepID=UPI00279B2599|nr:isocitrate lyase/phosphoenolpyruvate mutase family protein [Geminicoccaceae bacterium SCSIO 64248]
MPIEQAEKARTFRALHERSQAFVIPNPWDAGSARILAALGYEALATTSAGAAFVLGRRDGGMGRADALANARAIVEATDLPVAADLENGFGDAPGDAAETIRLAAEAGLVGGSIEDATGRPDDPIYGFEHAVERVAAAVEAARALPFPFTLTARAEGFLHGRADLDDIVRRLQAFETAGADVLYAPALPSLEAIRTVCASVGKPVNVLAARPGLPLSVADLEAAGVRRISLGSQFALAALGGFVRAAREVKEQGTFGFAADALPFGEASGYMR